MQSSPLTFEPRAPNKYWPFEYWLRWAVAVVGLLLIPDHGTRAVSFLLLFGLIGSAGYRAARWSASEQRRRMSEPASRYWYHDSVARGDFLRERWRFRAAWGLAFLLLAAMIGGERTIIVGSFWAMGWLTGDFVDLRSAAGEKEWQQWQEDLAQWKAESPWRHLADEWSWASPFPNYKAYCDARMGRFGEPLTYEQFSKARAGEPAQITS